MAPKPTLLSSVSGDIAKENGFFVRVLRLWIVPFRYNQNRIRYVEMLLHDGERNRIQATIEADLWDQFRDTIEEHGLYGMKNFRVEANDVLFRPAPHPFRLYFKQVTKVKPFTLDKFQDFPRDIYKFKTVDEIFSTPDENSNDLLDFIGALVPTEELRVMEATSRASRHLTFFLLDSGMRSISCTLWECYVDEFMTKVPRNRDVPVVVLVQLCRLKRDDSISLSTSFHVTKVIVDEHLPDIEDFRIHFMAAFRASSQSSGQISCSSGNAGNFGPVETIKKLRDAKEARGYWFYGQITRVISRDNWSYSSCPEFKCAKKVKRVGDGYVCDKCSKKVEQPVYKYCLKLEVQDRDAFTTVLLWDEQCRRLIGKNAMQLHSQLEERVGADGDLPKEISDLEMKSYMYKISEYQNNSGGGRTYIISSLCDDPSIIEFYKPKEPIQEVYDSDDDLDLMFLNETQGDSNVPPDASCEVGEDESNTPSSKRILGNDEDESAIGSNTQRSSNKKMKNVKIEKP